jgi:hypothetical protein
VDRVAVFNNFDPLVPCYHDRYVELIEAQGADSGPLLRAAGVGQVHGDVQPTGWEPLSAGMQGFRVEESPSLAWIVPSAAWAEADADAELLLLDESWSPEASVILSGVDDGRTVNPAGVTDVEFFEVLRDSSDDKRFQIVTQGGGYLVLATAWYPGWTAEINDESAPLYRANLAFMAVEIPPGGGDVTIRYLPTISPISLVVSMIAFFVTLMLVIIGLIRQDHIGQIPVQ